LVEEPTGPMSRGFDASHDRPPDIPDFLGSREPPDQGGDLARSEYRLGTTHLGAGAKRPNRPECHRDIPGQTCAVFSRGQADGTQREGNAGGGMSLSETPCLSRALGGGSSCKGQEIERGAPLPENRPFETPLARARFSPSLGAKHG